MSLWEGSKPCLNHSRSEAKEKKSQSKRVRKILRWGAPCANTLERMERSLPIREMKKAIVSGT
jgi:hypothetical protein